ncbi:MAG TPA: TrmH family RNA methyltransferase, partial [Rhizomicrobium sp.]|nr:TrmH family RNA methyltransferase [Rhizomicrobium sp.]
AEIVRHASWQAYHTNLSGRLIVLTTRAQRSYTAFMFGKDDTLMLGRESAGVPDYVHETAHARLRVPMQSGQRALNVAQAGAMVLGEALRQTNSFPQ